MSLLMSILKPHLNIWYPVYYLIFVIVASLFIDIFIAKFGAWLHRYFRVYPPAYDNLNGGSTRRINLLSIINVLVTMITTLADISISFITKFLNPDIIIGTGFKIIDVILFILDIVAIGYNKPIRKLYLWRHDHK
ncbi:hypothetical protein [Acetilactobacillus jinshanensis]|uniref:Uncharacterized protein n=1 Tax=Acetilactobacillus jinshanensis TaxID=1720083 RepID=A0A4P6ZJ50_9LACO|nr:hypothetical protein [Acetilactobacillus jinshanensis]QBP17676.1 hypothetical protein ELX58_00420 [Acetilactobacillus jinshanensis]URL61780.1 hypothetical protein HGK75_07530 [uncultured bacterium]